MLIAQICEIYLKYISKGSDQASIALHANDEILQYLTGRYIGPCQAVGIILEFPIVERWPPVERLTVHLPGEQQVYVRENTPVRNHQGVGKTKLTEFMELCKQDPFAKTLTYPDVPKFYTWNRQTYSWQRRRQGKPVENFPEIREANVLSRVYTISPRCGDLYYLRLLLHHVKGPESFVALRTFEDNVLPTFKDVCLQLGLLLGDNHWQMTMEDAEKTRMPRAMRDLFVVILTSEVITAPLELWDRFKNAMSEDFLHTDRRACNNYDLPIGQAHYEQALA